MDGWMNQAYYKSAFNHSWSYHRLQVVGVYVLDPSCTSPTCGPCLLKALCFIAGFQCDIHMLGDILLLSGSKSSTESQYLTSYLFLCVVGYSYHTWDCDAFIQSII